MRRTGRSTEGVRLMVMADEDRVCGVASVEEGGEVGDAPQGDAAPIDAAAPADGAPPAEG